MASSRVPILVLLLGLAACESKKLPTPPNEEPATSAQVDAGPPEPEKKKGPAIVHEEGPMPKPDTAIATAGDVKVTVEDFEEASRISLLFAPDGQTELTPEQLAAPHVHVTMTQSLLHQKLVAKELERRGQHPTTEQIVAYLRDHGRLAKFGKNIDDPEALKAQLEPLGLTQEALFKVAWAELANQMLAKAMLNEIADEDIWKSYAFQRTTRTAVIVGAANVPTPDELDEWVGDHADEIDAQFQKHQNKYRTPKRVQLNIIKPAPGTKTTDEKLKQAADLLRKGVQPPTIAKETGLQTDLGAQLVRGENPQAFAMKVGEVGWTSDGPRGAYAWKVVGFEESRLPEMNRPLRREIGAELMRTTGVVESLKDKLAKADKLIAKAKLKASKADELVKDPTKTDELRKKIEDLGLSFLVATFPNSPAFPLPKQGLAEEVITTAFTLEPGKSSDPVLSRERGFLVRVIATGEPSREEFEANLDAHRKAFFAALEPQIVTQWVQNQLRERAAKVDVKPLRIKFGVLQKAPQNE